MRVLVIGGSGHVGGLINPYLKERHELRVFDVKPPAVAGIEFVQGSVLDVETVKAAMVGMEGLVYLAMGIKGLDEQPVVETNYDVSLKGLHLTLVSAVAAGVRRVVYTSTLSVYRVWSKPHVQNEDTPPDSPSAYGFTKRLGEEVCELFARTRGLSAFVLRLCNPLSDADWQESAMNNGCPGSTSASDLARAVHLALAVKHEGFKVLHITGDYENRLTDLSRAKAVLGWEPLARPGHGARAAAEA